MPRTLGYLRAVLLMQRGHLFVWVPVCLGCGIGLYFALKFEPDAFTFICTAMACAAFAILSRFLNEAISPLAVGVALVLAGGMIAGARAHWVEEPVLGWRYYGPVEGRVVGIDRSASDKVRVTLDRVVLRDVAPERTPRRVRLSLHSPIKGSDPVPGLRVMTTGHLAPPSGPVEPGGFDFQRHAWFLGVGAVGYTRVPLLALAPPDGEQRLFAARMALSARVQAELPGEAGAFAAAIMTGDRAGMGQETLTALRVTNLAHLLAISGLHMGLLAGFVFATLRIALAAVPWIALRAPVKPLAAAIALAVAAGYLALSGGNVATERAFVMAAVVLVAVMLNRRAFSLRAVALAAIIVLCLRPEALLGPGFQMSFAATTALVAVFGWINAREALKGPRWLRPVLAVVISSTVAGLATAPIAAAHFNQFAHYGLIANLLSVPLMGAVVMPAAVLAACLLPFGFEWIGLTIMGLGLDWILGVAHVVSNLEGARGTVVSPGPAVLPLLALGGLFLALWQGRSRALGAVPMVLALVLWSQTTRPDVLISDTGSLVGVMTPDGRALSAGRGAGFIAQNWLENDGDAAEQAQAATRWTDPAPGGVKIAALRGKRAAEALTGCGGAEWLVLNTAPTIAPGGLPCQIVHPGTLRRTGALALYSSDKGLRMVSARQVTGARLWNTRPR